MREYPIKKNHRIDDEMLHSLMKEIFGNVSREGDFLVSSYGSLDVIRVKFSGKNLLVETSSNNKKELYQETISRYNNFIERATGYSAKERKKLLTKI
ncbi:MAG: DUF5611 family protein [Thermoplasmata archaeon]|nr:hypothetical protein [Thermoplasmatales archaeon]